jgi:hypothetical protein
VQRSYYVPVTCYQTKTYYEPVTTYRTSYFYEPVTTYRYSCYFDPCTCSYQQVACPQTCYQLRSQCCPVQSWVQRCCSVPVTTYQQSCYWEPVTTCCPSPCNPCCAPGTTAPPSNPGVYDQRTAPQPGVGESREGGTSGTSNKPPFDIYRKPVSDPMPPASSQRQLTPQYPATPRSAPPPNVKLDRIVLMPNTPGVEGQVVRNDRAPAAGARVLFVNAERQGVQQTVTADAQGQFRAELASGNWLIYVHGANGDLVFHKKIEVKDETRQVTLVSR